MNDIETGEGITLNKYVSLVDMYGERVSMNGYTFVNEIDKNKKYFLKNPPKHDLLPKNFKIGDPMEGFLLFIHEIRDSDDNILLRSPFLYIPQKGIAFKKTLEYFATKEKIKVN